MRRPSEVSSEALLSGGRHQPFVELQAGRPFIQASGQVIQFPAHVLVGQGEELAHGLGTGCTHGLEQPFHHGAEQLVRLQVQRRLHETGVAPVQQVGAEQLQPTGRPVQERPDDRLGGRISRQRRSE